MRVVEFVNLFLYALVAGVFWGTWFSLSRSMASITPQTFLEVGRIMIQNLGTPMSLLIPATLVTNLTVVVALFRRKSRPAAVLATAALVALVLALIVTLAVNVPIDNQIHQWTLASLPADWSAIRDRWEFFHALRTFVALAGLGCVFASALSVERITG
jgi:uncharacterized membrane protein